MNEFNKKRRIRIEHISSDEQNSTKVNSNKEDLEIKNR